MDGCFWEKRRISLLSFLGEELLKSFDLNAKVFDLFAIVREVTLLPGKNADREFPRVFLLATVGVSLHALRESS